MTCSVSIWRLVFKALLDLLKASLESSSQPHLVSQIVFDEKELRREISHAIKNVHGVRQVERNRYTKLSDHTNSALTQNSLLLSLVQVVYSNCISSLAWPTVQIQRNRLVLVSTVPHRFSNPPFPALQQLRFSLSACQGEGLFSIKLSPLLQ